MSKKNEKFRGGLGETLVAIGSICGDLADDYVKSVRKEERKQMKRLEKERRKKEEKKKEKKMTHLEKEFSILGKFFKKWKNLHT